MGRDDQQPTADTGQGESLLTVIIALAMNAAIAVAKSVAAALTGSASMVAEAAHSWADTGNEVFLLLAEKRGQRPADAGHPLGYGRDTYIWSMFAAVGLFTAGAVVSVWHGVQVWGEGGEADYRVNYVVLALAFVLESVSFRQAVKQTRGEARRFGVRPLVFINRTSNPTLRSVFLEDLAALVGILLAGAGVLLHQLTGDGRWDAAGSIAVGLLLGVVAVFLIQRNRDFLIGQGVSPRLRDQALAQLLELDGVERVTRLHLEYVGPMRFLLVAAVDLAGDAPESSLARSLRRLENEIEGRGEIAEAVLTLATPEEQALELAPPPRPGDGKTS